MSAERHRVSGRRQLHQVRLIAVLVGAALPLYLLTDGGLGPVESRLVVESNEVGPRGGEQLAELITGSIRFEVESRSPEPVVPIKPTAPEELKRTVRIRITAEEIPWPDVESATGMVAWRHGSEAIAR